MAHPPPPDTGSTFRQRLGYYLFGIAFGLLILGWFQVQKMQARQATPGDPPPAAENTQTP